MKTALVCTVLNEGADLARFLLGIDRNLDCIDAVVIVDGGSSDGTYEQLLGWSFTTGGKASIKRVPGCNIAAGRNHAIRSADAELILITDAGCELADGWAYALIQASLVSPEAAAIKGAYVGRGRTRVGKAAAAVLVMPLSSIAKASALPSSRSFAVTRRVWEQVGGYPESLQTAEDTLFAVRIREIGEIGFAPHAIAIWDVRDSIRALFRQYARYGQGDAHAGTNYILMRRLGLVYLTIGLLAKVHTLSAAILLAAYLALRLRRQDPFQVGQLVSGALVILATDAGRIIGFLGGQLQAKMRASNRSRTAQ